MNSPQEVFEKIKRIIKKQRCRLMTEKSKLHGKNEGRHVANKNNMNDQKKKTLKVRGTAIVISAFLVLTGVGVVDAQTKAYEILYKGNTIGYIDNPEVFKMARDRVEEGKSQKVQSQLSDQIETQSKDQVEKQSSDQIETESSDFELQKTHSTEKMTVQEVVEVIQDVIQDVEEPVVEEPVKPVVEEPVKPVVEEPVKPVVEEPVKPVVEEPVKPVVEEPVKPVVEEPVAPVVEEPVKPEVKEPVAPVVEEPVAPEVKEPVAPVVEEPVKPVVEESVAPVVEEPVKPVVEEPVKPVVEEPVAPVAQFNLPASGLVGEILRDYDCGYYSNHYNGAAIDILNSEGTPIHAAASGTVTLAGWYGGYGNCVIIDNGNGYSTLYGHFSSLDVIVGQTVTKGQQIGGMGSTGSSTANHVHFEVRLNDEAQKISDYFNVSTGDYV
jgi:hypothetical protein